MVRNAHRVATEPAFDPLLFAVVFNSFYFCASRDFNRIGSILFEQYNNALRSCITPPGSNNEARSKRAGYAQIILLIL